jgi:predicted porin
MVDNDTTDNDLALQNFGSRLIWSGDKDLGNGLTGVARLEFGINPDNNSRGTSGIDRTRQLWAGVQGGFGTVKVGAQYAAFYDQISSNTDIAWWGSCWTQEECGRETQVLKYSGATGDLSYAASISAQANDVDNDALDQIEFGVNYAINDYTVGLGVSSQADDGADDGGTLIGLLASGPVGPVNLALTIQMADQEFANAVDDVNHITVAGSMGDFYAIINQQDNGSAGNDPFYATLGYSKSIGDGALMYFEYQTIDNDTAADAETIVRATFKFDLSIVGADK